MNIYQPYCYLIGWSKLNKWYYGSRTAKNCNPLDFWTKYFTSSKYVTEFRKLHGEPDIIKIRKVFNDRESCLLWENKILKKLWKFKQFWLNKKFDSTKFVPTIESIASNIASKNNRSIEYDLIVRNNISRAVTKCWKENPDRRILQSEFTRQQNKSRTPETNVKISKSITKIMQNRTPEEWDIINNKKRIAWSSRTTKRKSAKKYKCDYCDIFCTKNNLQNHINAKH